MVFDYCRGLCPAQKVGERLKAIHIPCLAVSAGRIQKIEKRALSTKERFRRAITHRQGPYVARWVASVTPRLLQITAGQCAKLASTSKIGEGNIHAFFGPRPISFDLPSTPI